MRIDYIALAPELILTVFLCVVLVLDLFVKDDLKWLTMPVSSAGVLVTLGALAILAFAPRGSANILHGGVARSTLGGMFVLDPFALLFKIVFCVAALLVFSISHDYLKGDRIPTGEYYTLILCSLLGMLTIASSRDLIAIFVSLELISIPTFVLAGLRRSDLRSNEAALKFFLFGVLSSALMIYGMSLVYGITGTTNLRAISDALGADAAVTPVAILSIFFVVVGFGFKISAFPFQWWVPDTYEGSPVPIAAFLSVASKTAGFVGLLQVMFLGFRSLSEVWSPLLAIVSVLTMTFGNLVALQQKHIVRLLAYSSIAQAGYILLPLGVVSATNGSLNHEAFVASVVYLLIYAFMETGAFACAVVYGKRGGGYMVSDYAGLFRRSPGLAMAMTVFLLSLAGIVPLAGWFAKFVVFLSAIDAGAGWLAAAMAVNTVIALFYYVNVVVQMAFKPPPADSAEVSIPALPRTAIAIAALVIVVAGLLPNLFSVLAGASTLI